VRQEAVELGDDVAPLEVETPLAVEADPERARARGMLRQEVKEPIEVMARPLSVALGAGRRGRLRRAHGNRRFSSMRSIARTA